jgi:hypothetical protein
MPKSETFNVGDNCIILVNEIPTQSVICRKVVIEEFADDGVTVNTTVQLYVAHKGNQAPYTGKIFKSKDAMLSDFASSLK